MSQNYIENLRGMPVAERRRLLEGDWDFDDDDSVLFKLHLLQTTDAAPDDQQTYCGCDPSRGGDKTVFTALQGDVVTDQLAVPYPGRRGGQGHLRRRTLHPVLPVARRWLRDIRR